MTLTTRIQNGWKKLLLQLQEFFFEEAPPYGLACLRILLPLVLLTLAVPRWFFVRELYSTEGSVDQLGTGFGAPDFLPVLSPEFAVALHTFQILCLIGTCIGWQTRISLIGATILFNYFSMLDVLGTVSKLTVIAGHGLLLLSVSPAGELWSVDAWLKRRRESRFALPHEPQSPRFPIWSQRLIQLLIAIIYFAAAITKVHTPAYFSGDQMMYWLVTNINGPKPIGEYMTEYPGFLVFSSYLGFVWEVLFLFFCWRGLGRIAVIGMGVLFHTGTFIMLGLQSFPMVMFCLYLSFVNEQDFQWGMALLRKAFRRLHIVPLRSMAGWIGGFLDPIWNRVPVSPAISLALFVVLAGSSAVLGITAEHRLDLYQERSPNGPVALKEISPERLALLTSESQPLRDVDKIFSFEIGTLELGGRLWNRCCEYRTGDRMICEVGFNPPHEDMWIECALMDSSGRAISRPGQTALRENLRTFFTFVLGDELEPGDYSLVLYSRGQEVIHRKFKIVGESSPIAVPVAN